MNYLSTISHDSTDKYEDTCPMLYAVTLSSRQACETAVVSSQVLIAGLHNAEAFAAAFDGDPDIEVSVEPDTYAYIRKRHPHLAKNIRRR